MDGFSLTTDWLRARALASPKALAVRTDELEYSFEELDGMVSRLAGHLQQEGAAAGDHIAMLMPNSLAAVCCVFALARLGTIAVPLNTRLTPGEINWQLNRADCVRLLCLSGTEDTAREAANGRLSVHVLPSTAASFESWVTSQPMGDFRLGGMRDLNALQAIQFTSGTTGFPKGTMITFANHLWGAVGSAFKLGVQANDRWLVCLPLYHVGGMAILFRSCLYGTSIVLQKGFDEASVIDSLWTEKITLISLVPTMLKRLLDAGLNEGRAPQLRLILLGGAGAPVELLDRTQNAGLPVAVTYGLTETTSQVATMRPEETESKPGSPGRPLLFSEVDIRDESGCPAEAYLPGEVVVRGPTVMAGYYADEKATAATLKDGWLHTGDLGYLDDHGDLWILNRRSDLIISGGENIYPAEIERVLRSHPRITEACVVGLPHADWGQQVAALVQLDHLGSLSQEDLLRFTRQFLAGYKQPRVIAFTEAIPLTGPGKIHRRAVADFLAAVAEQA